MPWICESVRRLDAAHPVVVDTDPAEQVRRQLPVRVEPLALLQETDPVEVERGDALGLFGGDLPPDVREPLVLAETVDDRLSFLRRAVAQTVAQSCHHFRRWVDNLRRNRVDGIGVHARREEVAAPIEDVAALGWRVDGVLLLALGADDQIGVVEHLQRDELCLDAGGPQPEQRRRDDYPSFQGHPPGSGRLAHAHRCSALARQRALDRLIHRSATMEGAGGSAGTTRSMTIASSLDGATR